MTHFITAIVVPKSIMEEGKSAADSYIEEKMEPYSESHEVDPYLYKTKDEAKKEIEEYIEGLKDKKKKEAYKKKSWSQKVDDYYGHEVDEKGNVMTTWNEDSFWDWYRIGGRWDGMILENEQSSEDGFNFDDRHETLENNSISAKALLQKVKKETEKFKPYYEATKIIAEDFGGDHPFNGFGFADIFRKWNLLKGKNNKVWHPVYDKIQKRIAEFIRNYRFYNRYLIYKVIDIKGNLHEGKDYGWFGYSKNNTSEKDWEKEYLQILEEAKDGYIVQLDCHV